MANLRSTVATAPRRVWLIFTPSPPTRRQKPTFTCNSQHHRIRKQVRQEAPITNNPITHNNVPTQDRRFHYQGWNLIAEADPDKTFIKTYLWGLDLSGTFTGAGGTGGLLALTIARGPAAGTHLVTTDGQGNVTGLINATTGQTTAAYTYDPFGQLLSATGPAAAANPIRFSTRYEDPETSLLYYGYRFLHPASGRWLNRDPLGEAGGVNLYGFVGNQPNGRIDLYGLSFWDDAQTVFLETGGRLQRGWDGAVSGAKNVGNAFLDVSKGLNQTGAWWGEFIGDAIYDPVAWEKQKAALAGGAGMIAGFWGDYATDSEMRKQVNEALGNSAATTIHGIMTDPDKASKFFAAIGANAAFAIAGARGQTLLLNSAGEVIATLKMSLDEFRLLQKIAKSIPERAPPVCRPKRPNSFTGDSAVRTDLGPIMMKPPVIHVSPTLTYGELAGKSADEIRALAAAKGLIPHPTKPDKWLDPITGKERLRLDPGHFDIKTGLPYDDVNATVPHHQGYGPGGVKFPVVDPNVPSPTNPNGNPHFPTRL